MLQSMTGFGRGEAAGAGISVVVELRSVNNRYLDVVIRGPREYLSLEPKLQRMVKAAFRRGRIEVHVRRQPLRTNRRVEADAELYRAYTAAIDRLLGEAVDPTVRAGAIGFVLSQPAVLSVVGDEVDVMAEGDILEVALEGALADLREMRTAEGAALATELEQQLFRIIAEVDAVDGQMGDLSRRLRQRMETRLRRLLSDRIDEHRLVQESAMLAERADVTEELTRLRSHALQFKDAMDRDEAVGRRLDFLIQEMNREVNTIGSKASEHPVSHRVVEMKAILERMREQSANVE
jgi:uncharacterized protein (TIGR00255 family)